MTDTIEINVTDTTGQLTYTTDVPSAATVDEIVARLLSDLGQSRVDSEGRPLAYGVRSETEGRYLGGREQIGQAIQPNDTLRLMPTVEAG